MSELPIYEDPPAHLAALRQRLANATGLEENLIVRRLRAMANVVVAQMLPTSAVKGGTSINLRLGPDLSRFSIDLDATRPRTTTEGQFLNQLRANLDAGWSGFTGTVLMRKSPAPKNIPVQYLMVPIDVKLSYRARNFMTVRLELAMDELGSVDDSVEIIDGSLVELFTRIGLEAPSPVAVISREHQAVQKLHACTTPDQEGRNERAHDLVDLQLLCRDEDVDLAELRRLGVRLFDLRKGTPWPPTVQIHEGWDGLYTEASEGLDVLPLPAAVEWANDLVKRAELEGS